VIPYEDPLQNMIVLCGTDGLKARAHSGHRSSAKHPDEQSLVRDHGRRPRAAPLAVIYKL